MKQSLLSQSRIKTLYWDDKHTIEEIANRLDISYWALYNFMKKNNITRRNRSESGYLLNRLKPQFQIKPQFSTDEEKLKLAGIMLYWAEGTFKGNTVDFVNSNPDMVQVFLRFLRQICGVDENRLRLYLYAYSYQDLNAIKNYWHKVTNISLDQFTKPYIRNGHLDITRRKLPYGLVHVRYNDKKLLRIIEDWIKEYIDNIVFWAGTQVAKGGRLSNGSFPLKGAKKK